jgi:hypothetical protein
VKFELCNVFTSYPLRMCGRHIVYVTYSHIRELVPSASSWGIRRRCLCRLRLRSPRRMSTAFQRWWSGVSSFNIAFMCCVSRLLVGLGVTLE